ncbi:hypothetical protein [Kitasatospora sp. NPDC001175]|uniref:hypothetical protein n=1 Tax=Kitasatospora sp. NPDC001175 TaxID=3157103 RepID=UPI003CFD51BC
MAVDVGLGVGLEAGCRVGVAVGEVEAQGAVGAALVDDAVELIVGVQVLELLRSVQDRIRPVESLAKRIGLPEEL